MDWMTVVDDMSKRGSNGISYQDRNIAWKGGAWTGRGLGYVAELPVLGDFLDGVMLGYAAQRCILQSKKVVLKGMEAKAEPC